MLTIQFIELKGFPVVHRNWSEVLYCLLCIMR